MQSDTNFDGIATSFEEEIYGSSKGYIRLRVLWKDLLSEIPQIGGGGLSILDAGGAGHMALRMAQLGNTVVLCNASREMLDRAAQSTLQEGLSDRITIVHAAIQDLERASVGEFDVITCHAVLEWPADPWGALDQLVKLLMPDGHLSLMFYNRNAALLKRILRGRVCRVFARLERRPSSKRLGRRMYATG